MFNQILDFSQKFASSLYDFVKSILEFLSYEFTIGENNYTLFTLLFTGSVIIILSYGIIKFIADIIT